MGKNIYIIKISKSTNKIFLLFPDTQLINISQLPCKEAKSCLWKGERQPGTEMNDVS